MDSVNVNVTIRGVTLTSALSKIVAAAMLEVYHVLVV